MHRPNSPTLAAGEIAGEPTHHVISVALGVGAAGVPWTHSDTINAIVAGATLLAVVVALFQDQIRVWLAGPRLKLTEHSYRGHPTGLYDDGHEVGTALNYQWKVVNGRPWATAQNCRVVLVGVEERGADGRFHRRQEIAPLPFSWAPGWSNQGPLKNVGASDVVDFARLEFYSFDENAHRDGFVLCLLQGDVGTLHSQGAMRYWVEVRADNFTGPPQVFEVSWDGHLSDKPEDMVGKLVIREVDYEEALKG